MDNSDTMSTFEGVSTKRDEKISQSLCEKAEYVHQFIGTKWVSLIIHALMQGPKRFSEIDSYIPEISKRVLNERIKSMEENGLIMRNIVAEHPTRTEYSLTTKGRELGLALQFVEDWAARWI